MYILELLQFLVEQVVLYATMAAVVGVGATVAGVLLRLAGYRRTGLGIALAGAAVLLTLLASLAWLLS